MLPSFQMPNVGKLLLSSIASLIASTLSPVSVHDPISFSLLERVAPNFLLDVREDPEGERESILDRDPSVEDELFSLLLKSTLVRIEDVLVNSSVK